MLLSLPSAPVLTVDRHSLLFGRIAYFSIFLFFSRPSSRHLGVFGLLSPVSAKGFL